MLRIVYTHMAAPVWGRPVHVYDLSGHPKAMVAYAWSSPVEGSSKRQFFAVLEAHVDGARVVLEIPPVNSALLGCSTGGDCARTPK